jgi:S-methyl-5-thioribulose 1-phosphate isomerase
MMNRPDPLIFSGERFRALYHLSGSPDEARARARDICLEQTVEFPEDLIDRADIRDQVFGRIEEFRTLSPDRHEALISYAQEISGGELTQLLNVLFGNISLQPGIRLVDFELPESMLMDFPGPRFGAQGLRELTGISRRPLLCTALKPMGLSPGELADMAYSFALGGMDMIKDDHGLADQSFCPFDERVRLCAQAVNRANEKTGGKCLYFPNVTAPADVIMDRAALAKSAGAGGVVISPGLTGLDAMKRIAADIALPILSHPAFQGAFTVSSQAGIAPGVMYGKLNRLAGADACIFPSFGGRFSFTKNECRDVAEAARKPMHGIKAILTAPAGGMTLKRVPELIEFYGPNVILLIGGDLHRHGPDLAENCRRFVRLVDKA